MALIVEAVGKTGIVERIAVEGGGAVINAQPGLTYRILDGNGRQVNANATVRRVGDHLIIEGLPEEATVQLTDFFFVCTPNDPCALDLEGLGGARGETISQISEPIAAMADGSFVLHAPASMATPVAPESEFSAKPALAGLALLAVGGGGGGGGSGGDGPPPPPPGSTTVTSAPFTNDSTPVITGTAVPGSQITITLDIPGSGPVTFNTIADGNGDWSVDTGAATPSAGTMPAGGIPEGAPTTVRVLTAGSTAVVSYQLAIDRVLPDAPVIEAVTGDDVINADEGREANPSPITVQGTAEAGARVRVSWHGDDQIAIADADGRWAVTFDGQKIPDGNYIISAVATDVAGNTGPAANRAVAVATGRPSAPDFDDVAGDNIVNAAETADGVTITGTTSAGTQVFVSIAGLFTDREATVTGTDWSVTVSPAELGQLPDGQPFQVTAFASDGVNRSVVSASDPVRVDRTPPGPATIDGPVEGDNVVNFSEAGDGVTITGTAEAGGTVRVSWGGVNLTPVNVGENGRWTAVFDADDIPNDGNHTVRVIAVDAAGNPSATPTELGVRVDTTVAAPTIALASDTGSSGNDGITRNGTINVSGLEAGGSWEYSTNSGANWTTGSGNTFTLSPGTYAANAVRVRQTDAAGNQSGTGNNPIQITVDTDEPDTPSLQFVAPATINVIGLEGGTTTWEYSINGGTWTPGTGTSFTLPPDNYESGDIRVRQTDAAGNQSGEGSNASPIIIDTEPPDAPSIELANDTGVDGGDGVTSDGTITVNGLEGGTTTWEYSINNGSDWAAGSGTTFMLPAGAYAEGTVQVRQTDAAGNESEIGTSSIAITVDTTDPATPGLTFSVPNTVIVSSLEGGTTTWEYSFDGGSSWTPGSGTSFTLDPGTYPEDLVQVRQTDLAGNTSVGSNQEDFFVSGGGENAGDGGSFALMSLDLAIPGFEMEGEHEAASGSAPGASTPSLTVSLSDVLSEDGPVFLLNEEGLAANASGADPSLPLDNGVEQSTAQRPGYDAAASSTTGPSMIDDALAHTLPAI